MGEFKIQLHKFNNNYIGELQIKKNQNSQNQKDSIFIIILDISGSMGQNVGRIVKNYLPKILRSLNIKEEEIIHLITFESNTQYTKIPLSELEISTLYARGGTQMSDVFEKLKLIINDENKSYRILTISDGEV